MENMNNLYTPNPSIPPTAPSALNREYGWDDAIENDSLFEVLPEGDYDFRVVKFERARHPGSDKLPPCNKAILTIELSNGTRRTTIEHHLFLHSKCEGLLCEFFTAIGQRKHGERLVPRWNEVIGSTGTCKVIIDKWTGRNDQPMESNKIRRFYEKGHTITAPAAAASVTSTPVSPAPASSPVMPSGYTAGQF